MAQVSGAERKFRPVRVEGFGRSTVALALFAAPLMLSGCMTGEKPMKAAALAPKASANAADAYGYAPVRLMAFADGTRAPMPSAKPDLVKLGAEPAAPAPVQKAHVDARTDEAAKADPVFALQADVAERKASMVVVSEVVASVPQSSHVLSQGTSAPGKEARLTSVASAALPPASPQAPARKGAIGTTIAAVTETASLVGQTAQAVGASAQSVGVSVGTSAKAIAVAAIDRTSAAASALSERLGDTFKGRDTITGDARMDHLIEQAAADNGIPSELAYAVVRVESHYNPLAKGSGVYGLSQIQPSTARSLGFSGPNSALFDAETNLRYGMKYLAGAWQQGGHDVCQAAMKYKGGHRTTQMSRSAAVYCANVKRHMAAIERRRMTTGQPGMIVASNDVGRSRATFAGNALSSARALPGVAQPAAPTLTALDAAKTVAPLVEAASSTVGREIAASALVPASVAIPAAAPRLVPADRWQATADAAAVPMNVSFGLAGDQDGARSGRVR